jgi:hypothetical protein
MKPAIERVDISTEELEALLERVREVLSAEDYRKLAAAVHTLSYVTELLENRETTLHALRRLLCQSSTEKTEQVLKEAGVEFGPEHRKRSIARRLERAHPQVRLPDTVATARQRTAEGARLRSRIDR